MIKVKNSSFLITGGTGSFGQVMVKKLLSEGAGLVRVVSRDEAKQFNLISDFECSSLQLILGDIRDYETTLKALSDIEYVFHAAALKHVPMSEENPFEYVRTNIIGSHNLLRALSHSDVKSAVFLSTDKAVYPINAMGMSKALMEKLVRSIAYPSNSINSITRYGNVIGSRGSVIPYFIDRIKNRKSINITDWHMTRFMMSLDESVDLVLHAMSTDKSGRLFVRKSPSATLETILFSVEQLLEKKASEILIKGVRPGEKIHETLLNSEEKTFSVESDEYFEVENMANTQKMRRKESEYTSENTNKLEVDDLVNLLSNNPQIKQLLNF